MKQEAPPANPARAESASRPAPPPLKTGTRAEPEARGNVRKPRTSAAVSLRELNGLMGRFRNIYNRGDLAAMTGLFGSGQQGRFKNQYRKIFSKTARRNLILKRVRWRREGNRASGQGGLSLTVNDRESGSTQNFLGKISFQVEKRGGTVVITDIDHVLWKAPAGGRGGP